MKSEQLLNRRFKRPHPRHKPREYTIETDPILKYLLSRIPDMARHGFGHVAEDHAREYLERKWPEIDPEEILARPHSY